MCWFFFAAASCELIHIFRLYLNTFSDKFDSLLSRSLTFNWKSVQNTPSLISPQNIFELSTSGVSVLTVRPANANWEEMLRCKTFKPMNIDGRRTLEENWVVQRESENWKHCAMQHWSVDCNIECLRIFLKLILKRLNCPPFSSYLNFCEFSSLGETFQPSRNMHPGVDRDWV